MNKGRHFCPIVERQSSTQKDLLMTTVMALILISVLSLILPSTAGAAESPIFRSALDNGVVLLTKANESKDVVAISIVLKLSVFDETDQKVGIRTMLSDLIMERIYDERAPSGIRLTELMGVMSGTETTPDYVIFNFITTTRHYKKVLELLSKSITTTSFDEALFKREKKVFTEAVKEGKGGFSAIYEIFLQIFYKYHPYKASEDVNVKGLEKLEKTKLEEFMKSKLSADRIVIGIAGNVNYQETKTLVDKYFGALEIPRKSSRVEVQWEPKATEKEVFLSSLSQMAYLIIGLPAPSYSSPDYPAMKVLCALLGEGLNSRLWVELREKRGLAYELGSFYPDLEGPGHMMIYVISQPQNVIQSRRIIISELEKLKTGYVLDRELTDAKAKINGSYLLARESCKGQASHMAISEVIGGKYSLDSTMQKRLEDVSSADIRRVVNTYFEETTMLVVRPPGAFYIDWFR